MKHIIYFLTALIFSQLTVGNAFSQNCDNKSKIYRDHNRYIPSPDFPELTLKLNFIFLQREDGCCGFSKNEPEHLDIVNRIVKLVNKKYSKLVDPQNQSCYKGEDFVLDTKIRFKLHEIIEIKDDFLWNMDNGRSCPNDRNWYLNKIDSVLFKNPDYTNSINIYFPNSLKNFQMMSDTTKLEDMIYSNPCSQLPDKNKLIRSSKLCMPNQYVKYYTMKNYLVNDPEENKNLATWDEAIYYWFWETLASGVAHELGHTMGLMHSNKHHGANKCSESIMNQKHGKSRNYLPPTEIGKMHRNMRMSNIRYFLDEEVYSSIPWIINADTIIDVNYKVYEDVVIKSGQTLVVTCHLEMSPLTTIYLEPGAKLDLTNGTVNAVPGMEWKGVVYTKTKKCILKKKHKTSKAEIINPTNLLGYQSIKHEKQ